MLGMWESDTAEDTIRPSFESVKGKYCQCTDLSPNLNPRIGLTRCAKNNPRRKNQGMGGGQVSHIFHIRASSPL